MRKQINKLLNTYTSKELSEKTGIPSQVIRAISTGGYVSKKYRNTDYTQTLKQIDKQWQKSEG